MSGRPDTWMPLFIGDYLADTMHLTAEQHGAYLLLIMACWRGAGRLPTDEAQLASIAKLTMPRWRQALPIISAFFEVSPDAWRHKRVTQELASALRYQERAAAGGRAKAVQTGCLPPAKSVLTGCENGAPRGEGEGPLQEVTSLKVVR